MKKTVAKKAIVKKAVKKVAAKKVETPKRTSALKKGDWVEVKQKGRYLGARGIIIDFSYEVKVSLIDTGSTYFTRSSLKKISKPTDILYMPLSENSAYMVKVDSSNNISVGCQKIPMKTLEEILSFILKNKGK